MPEVKEATGSMDEDLQESETPTGDDTSQQSEEDQKVLAESDTDVTEEVEGEEESEEEEEKEESEDEGDEGKEKEGEEKPKFSAEALAELSRIASLSMQGYTPDGERIEKIEPVPADKKPPETKPTPEAKSMEEINFFEGKEEDDQLTIKDVNKALNNAFQMGQQSMLTVLPNVINSTRGYINATLAAENFYRENPDLSPYRPLVFQVSQEVLKEKPDLAGNTLGILAETEKKFREKYGLQKGTKPAEKTQVLPGGTKPRSPNPNKKGKKTDMEDDFEFSMRDGF